jgi:hypothetical protein
MGAVWGSSIATRRSVLLTGLATVLLVLVFGQGLARAAGCTTSWNGQGDGTSWNDPNNWSAGLIPGINDDVCINPNSSVTVVIKAPNVADVNSVQLGVGSTSGTQTLEVEGVDNGSQGKLAELDLENGGTIGPSGDLKLTGACTGAPCTHQAPSSVSVLGLSLTNNGTIESDQGDEAATREIYGDATNNGTITVNASLLWSGGSVDNQGAISLADGQTLTIGNNSNSAALTNDAGGQITNNGGSGSVHVASKATYNQGGGTTSPSTTNPLHPAVIMYNPTFFVPAPILNYTGTEPSAIEALGTVSLSGGPASGQSLDINGAGAACPSGTFVTAASGLTNAGTITVRGTCDSGLRLTTGTLTNTGTLTAAATTGNVTREVLGSLTNSGTFTVNGGTAFDKSGATLTQTGGTTTMGSNSVLDMSSSGATFQLQGGALSGGGQTQNTEAVINGPVNNTGGNITPGSASTPGLMTFDGAYTQGSGGTLTIPVSGAGGPSGVGTHYSQLAAAGNITLGGTLAIDTVSHPAVNDLDTIMATNGSLSGTFSTVTGRFTAGSTFGYKPTYGSNYAALEVGAALKVNRSGPGTGTVTSSPAGINCGSQCNTPFFQDQSVTLTAHPGSGSAFGSWSGACTGARTTCQVTMSQARTVTAKFLHSTTTTLTSSLNPAKKGKKVTYTATVSPNPHGGTVKFTSGGSTISGCGSVAVNTTTGKATCSVTYNSIGTRKIQATYSGDTNYGSSTSTAVSEKVTS